MSRKKTIEVNEASIIDLKAELSRKEELFKKERSQTDNSRKPLSKRTPAWPKQRKEQKGSSDSSPANACLREDEKALERSRHCLEAKAALYEKMASGEIEDEDAVNEDGGRYLVDFHRKMYSHQQDDSDDEYADNKREDIPEPSDPSEEWIDYVDSFGRERRCLRKDLPDLKAMDRVSFPQKRSSPPTLLSDDMRREMHRQKWEEEEQERLRRPVGDIHYQDIQYDELRAHGVGYYQFSKDKGERQEQMNVLNQYREQTVDARVRREKLKEKRKAALDARLAKIRERKMRKVQGDNENDQDSDNNEDSIDPAGRSPLNAESPVHNEPPTLSEIQERAKYEAERLKSARDTSLPGNWRRHQYLEHQQDCELIKRQQKTDPEDFREQEFAPPSFYYDESTTRKDNDKPRGHQQQIPDNPLHRGREEQTFQDTPSVHNEYDTSASKSENFPNHPPGESSYIPQSLPPPPKDHLAPPYLNHPPWQGHGQHPGAMPWPGQSYQYPPSPRGAYMPPGGAPSTYGPGGPGHGMYGAYPGQDQPWGYGGVTEYDGRQWMPHEQSMHGPAFQQVPNGQSDNPLSKLISFCQQNEPSL